MSVFSILGHPSQWPDLQRMHQLWAIVLGVVLILIVVGAWIHFHVRQTKLTVNGNRENPEMAAQAEKHETHHMWPRHLHGIPALVLVGLAVVGNGVMFFVNGSQALHHQQTVAANKALNELLGPQISNVSTSSKTLTDVLTFNVSGNQLTCPVKRTWSTKDYNNPSKYSVSTDTSLALGVKYEPNSSNVQKLTCPDGKVAQASAPAP